LLLPPERELCRSDTLSDFDPLAEKLPVAAADFAALGVANCDILAI
jgi:hypothetical protein